jgi:hypothetical protein
MHRLLLLTCVLFGLFVMHGVQATPSPLQSAGAMLGGGIHSHAVAPATMAGGLRIVSASDGCSGGHCGESHPGAVCLALLVVAGLILLLAAFRAGPLPPGMTRPHSLFVRRGPPQAKPPTVYQLSVLRL